MICFFFFLIAKLVLEVELSKEKQTFKGVMSKDLHKSLPPREFLSMRWPSFSPGNKMRAPSAPAGPVHSEHNVL